MNEEFIPMIVLGRNEKPQDCFGVVGSETKGYTLTFHTLNNDGQYDYGDSPDAKDLGELYFAISFQRVESIDAMISILQSMKKLMEKGGN